MKCRHCGSDLKLTLVDLGSAPPSNAYLTAKSLHAPEKWFPLKVLVCSECWLAQTEDFAQADELFDAEYAYFSGFSTSWLRHSESYVANMAARFGLDEQSHVVEVAANDGYLLQYVMARGIPCTGIEPTASTAAAARAKGIPIVEEFFGLPLAKHLASQGKRADLIAANNVLAHVPDINDFVAGFAHLLKDNGIATFEFPHLYRLIIENQFDTIYHEHFSYLSLTAVERIFKHNGLVVFDVEELPTHGGSLRVYAQKASVGRHPASAGVSTILKKEADAGMMSEDFYARFQHCTDTVKNDFIDFLLRAKKEGKRVAAYGAAAKGNTLMNYAGIRPDLIACVADRNPAKQGKFMPGSRIPIVNESHLSTVRPDYIVILPWNLRDEVMAQMEYARAWGARFVTAVPELRIS
ncbi:class I SAM-dependent methyltransferase [Propionivibrio dicarboxylicus]|uniref:Methyltransferase domain-containing protein n=1 Tax=Propionivibrio dicarboxylicus TaxID=83767 RepID=A0A1G8DYG7_9RHOO|nr:class I SAM-dependent methyltransferase [Propionivibrio dicarboxylicus]SDH62693.1 Methyltransferase domain-containing protein [Propionivibrio dicarboxylicus]